MYIRSLVNNKKMQKTGKRSFKINVDDSVVEESINNFRLLVIVFESGEDKIIAMGPVFGYKEIVE